MARIYAGILGSLAFATVMFRGLVRGGAAEATVQSACGGLLAFALIGYLAGLAAETIIGDSVRRRFMNELRAAEVPQTPGNQAA